MYIDLTTVVIEYWLKAIKLRPILTSVLSGILIIAVAIAATIATKSADVAREAYRNASLSYPVQLSQLDQVERNVQQLLEFIQLQRKTLHETEKTISSLQSERERLKILVDADEEVVKAFFETQEQRAYGRVWSERWIGFAFGFLASLIASAIWFFCRWLFKKLRSSPAQSVE